jgi:ketosteroid isomerase-like protein
MKSTDVSTIITRYLEALEEFDLDAAADCFTDDLFYSHPPYSDNDSEGRHEVQGREALIQLFKERGPKQVKHEVTTAAIEGLDGFVMGTFAAEGRVGSFVSTVRLAEDGRIAHYAAYRSVPPVGQNVRPNGASGAA